MKTLDQILICPSGVIRGFRKNTRLLSRLREIGLLPGTRVRLYMPAPLRDPVALYVNSAVFAVRRKALADIEYDCEES